MKKIIMLTFLTSLFLFAETSNKPIHSNKYDQFKKLDKSSYGWMIGTEKYSIYTSLPAGNSVWSFITDTEINDYVKNKLERSIGKLNTSNSMLNSKGGNLLTFQIELFKYNDSLDIYYGIIEMKVSAGIISKKKNLNNLANINKYRITKAIAGSKRQIQSNVYSSIDYMLSAFTDDYYYIKDL